MNATTRPGLAYDDAGNLLIDVRGPRFGAAITTAVLATALVVQGPVGVALVAFQVAMFAISTVAGLAWSPYGSLFRIVKRRLDQICANKDISVIHLIWNGRNRPIGFLTKHLITARIYNIDVTGKAMLLAKLQRPR